MKKEYPCEGSLQTLQTDKTEELTHEAKQLKVDPCKLPAFERRGPRNRAESPLVTSDQWQNLPNYGYYYHEGDFVAYLFIYHPKLVLHAAVVSIYGSILCCLKWYQEMTNMVNMNVFMKYIL